jgi:uncharacterized membrane protein
MKTTTKFISMISTLMILMLGFAAQAQTPDQPVARAVIFTSSICTFCREILERQLPPLLEPSGDQLEILVVDTLTPEGEQLYQAALTTFEVPRGTPQVFIGDDMLMGIQIPEKFPALIEACLAQGGVDWPEIPGLADYLREQHAPQSPAGTPFQGVATPLSTPSAPTDDSSIPIVRAILFWMEGCSHCHEVLDNVLPPLQTRYGSQLEIRLVEVATLEEVDRFYEIAAGFGIPRERVGVPLLVIGEDALAGGVQIPAELPALIEAHLSQGGTDWPAIPGLDLFGTQVVLNGGDGVVHAVLLSTPDCHDCQLIVAQVLKLSRQDYAGQFEVEVVNIITSEDVDYFYRVAAAYGLSKEAASLPLLILGDEVLVDAKIAARLPELLETSLQAGGAEHPQLPPRPDAAEAPSSTPSQTPPPVEMRDNGFTLAIAILVAMTIALAYSLTSFTLGKTFGLPAWTEWLIPLLIVIGIVVAGYLSYVETQAVAAVCGPVGDCNTVQSSPYARLFGVLPVGVLGLLGYLALLAAWLARRFFPRLARPSAIAFWGMAIFAVVFSMYLTYLEPFVIKAVCAWCLASAVIVTLLLLLGTPPVVQHFATADKDE